MRKTIRRAATVALTTLSLGFGALATASPAAATPITDEPVQTFLMKSCYANPTSCNTAHVRPYPEGYLVYGVQTGAFGCDFRVKDMTLGRVLRSGHLRFGQSGQISGLTRAHTYRLEIFGCVPGAIGMINGSPV